MPISVDGSRLATEFTITPETGSQEVQKGAGKV